MKDLFFSDKIIPANSITAIELVQHPVEKTYSIILRQGVGQRNLFTHSDYNIIKGILESIKALCDGVYVGDLIANELQKQELAQQQEEPKPKSRAKKQKKSIEIVKGVDSDDK